MHYPQMTEKAYELKETSINDANYQLHIKSTDVSTLFDYNLAMDTA